ncbi:hypothetical protein Pta6605_33400 [Pseudomonas amygdali pv. tabaci]|nr:hypothetical protein Pta6605_33400 [Pseudomonas amygdali pv. tabaci]
MHGEVGWRGTDNRIAMPQWTGNHIGVQLVGDADCQIDALADQVHGLVANQQIHRGAGVALQVSRHRWGQNRQCQ